MSIPLGTLNPWVTHGGAIQPGSVLVGLRGQTGTLGENTARDLTRGDGAIAICPNLVDAPTRGPAPTFALEAPRPNPSRGDVTFGATLSTAAWADLAVFDPMGRRVRTLAAGWLPAGVSRFRWDGRTDGWGIAPSGVYHVRLTAAGQVQAQRLVLVK